MLGALFRWLERHRRRQAAVKVAVRHFEATTTQSAHLGISRVVGEESEAFVVRVCYGNTKPPRRVWYRIGADEVVVAELVFDEAQPFGERLWR